MIRGAPRNRRVWYRRWWATSWLAVRATITLHDTPRRIATGVAMGLFTCPLPMIGQMLLAVILTRLLRGNVIASLPWTWITNPMTTPFIWYGCYRLGVVLWPWPHTALSFDSLHRIADDFVRQGLGDGVSAGLRVLGSVFGPLLLGTVLVGATAAALSYPLVTAMVGRFQARRARRAAAWREHLPAAGG